jgi:hypothetical protein
MGAISTFPTLRNILVSGNNIHNFTAGDTIKAGMVVAFASSGDDDTVVPALQSTGAAIGVALYGATVGQPIAVAGPGCIVRVQNDDSATDIDAGHWVVVSSNAVGGTVVEADLAIEAHTAGIAQFVGILVTDMDGSEQDGGLMLIALIPHLTASA